MSGMFGANTLLARMPATVMEKMNPSGGRRDEVTGQLSGMSAVPFEAW